MSKFTAGVLKMDTVNSDFQLTDTLNAKLKNETYQLDIVSKLARILRKDKSQNYMNRKLGYQFNQYAKWENGSKTIQWEDLLKICSIQKIDIIKKLARRFPFKDGSGVHSGAHIINFFLRVFFDNKVSHLSAYLQLKPDVVRRHINEKSTVSLNIILKLFLYRPIFYLYFFKDLGVLDEYGEIKENFEIISSLEQLEARYPFVSAVLYFTDTTLYKSQERHSSLLVAENTGLTLKQVDFSIEKLHALNLISFKQNKYHFNCVANELNSLTLEQTVRIMTYWMYRGISYLNRRAYENVTPETKNHACFRVCTTTKSVAQKINEKLAQTYYEINQMIKEADKENEEVVLKVLSMTCFGIKESLPYDFKVDEDVGLVINKESLETDIMYN